MFIITKMLPLQTDWPTTRALPLRHTGGLTNPRLRDPRKKLWQNIYATSATES